MSDLVPQGVEVRLGARDRKTSDKLATVGTLLTAQNVVMTKAGRYQRRSGTAQVAGAVANTTDLAAYDNELLSTDNATLRSVIGGTQTSRGSMRHLETAYSSAAVANDQNCHDFVRAGGYDWHVWYDSGTGRGVRYSVFDTASGAAVVLDGVINADELSKWPSIYAVGTDIVVLYMTVNAGLTTSALKARKIAQATPSSVGGETAVDTTTAGGVAQVAYDAARHNSDLIIGYNIDSTGRKFKVNKWTVSTMTSAGSVLSGGTLSTDEAIGMLVHDFSDSIYYFVGAGTSGTNDLIQIRVPTNLASVSTSLLTSPSGTWVYHSACGYVDGTLAAHHFAAMSDGTVVKTIESVRLSGGAVLSTVTYHNAVLASKPWKAPTANVYYLLMLTASYAYEESAYYAVDPALIGQPYARVFLGLANGDQPTDAVRQSRLPAGQMDGDTARVALMKIGPNHKVAVPQRQAWRVDFTPWQSREPMRTAGKKMVIPGGFLRYYDGNAPVEAGFHTVPKINTVAGGAAGAIPAGTYQYVVVPEWLNAKGEVEFGAPSLPKPVTIGGSLQIDVSIYATFLTSKIGSGAGKIPFTYAVYRTKINPGTNPPFFFTGRVNNTFAATVLFTDNTTDANLGEELYTRQGAVIENAPLPSAHSFWVWNNRPWFLLEENRRGFGHGKLTKPDFGLEWNEDFTGVIDDEHGDLTCGTGHGERNLLFKRNAVYSMSGDGPADDGKTGGFTEPSRLDGAPGTDNPRSVITTDLGTFYQAPDKVIWLITHGMERFPLGDPCVDITDTVTSAVLVPDSRHVRFTTAAGTTLVYDLTHRRWMTHTVQPAVGACLFQNVWHYVNTSGAIRKDSASSWVEDNAATYQMVIELTWISLAGLLGYFRLWAVQLLGEFVDNHTVSLELTADFGSTGAVTRSLPWASPAQQNHGYRMSAKVPLTMQQNASMKLKISDNSPTTGGAGIDALRLHCGIKPDRRPRLPTAHEMT